MTVVVPAGKENVAVPPPVGAAEAAALTVSDVCARLGSDTEGLAEVEAARRLRALGPNAVRSHRARWLPVLMSQLRSPLLLLLAVTARSCRSPSWLTSWASSPCPACFSWPSP